MQIQLTAPKIWLASEAVDFRCGVNRLSGYVINQLNQSMEDQLFIFYNRAKNKVKCLARHRHGMILLYKQLHKKKFTLKHDATGLIALDDKQLSWLLAGLDWVAMSDLPEPNYDDYF
jgi:transposase